MLIDTHAHLYWDSFKQDFDEVIRHSLDADVGIIINIGVDVETSKIAAELNSNKLKFYSSIGIHPHEAVKYKDNLDISIQKDIKSLEKIYLDNVDKVVAVGECGLDYAFSTSGESKPTSEVFIVKNLQRQLFQAQIDLAKKLNLPLIVHCRDDRSKSSGSTGTSAVSSVPSGSPPAETSSPSAWDEVLKMTKDYFGIYHCYSGLLPTTNRILQTNFLVSFAGNITYPQNEYLQEAARILPLEKITIETDSPFLPPQSKRGQRNEPAYVLEVVKEIARIKNQPIDQIVDQMWQNVSKIGIIKA